MLLTEYNAKEQRKLDRRDAMEIGREEGIEIGIDRGREEGRQEEVQRGITTLVAVMKEMGGNKDQIRDQLMLKYQLTKEEAEKYL